MKKKKQKKKNKNKEKKFFVESLGPSLRLELTVKKSKKCFCDELALI